MANVRLGRHEAENDALPFVCIHCGATAVVRRTHQLTKNAVWLSAVLALPVLLPALAFAIPVRAFGALWLVGGMGVYVVVQGCVRRGIVIRAPLCAAHQHHGMWPALVLPLGAIFFSVMCCTSTALIRLTERAGIQGIFSLVMWEMALIGFAVLITSEYTVIQLKELDEHSITLARVSQEFADAVNGRQSPEARQETPPSGDQIFDPERR